MLGRNSLTRFLKNSALLIAVLGFVLVAHSESQAQVPGGGGGTGGLGTPGTGGVEIDASGLISARARVENSGRLNQQRFAAADAGLNANVKKATKLRKISLTRLEAEVAKLLAVGQTIPPEMQYLAGMTKITNVFYYPDTKDIVIAGPAEGFFISADNHVVGMKSGRATLHLQDLIVALRAFSPEGKTTRLISCSIDPTQEGLVKFKEAYAKVSASGRFRPGDEAAVVNLFCNSLGLQEITINGVSDKTHFARVLVEADYRMKMIGIGLERPPVKVTSFIEKAKPNTVARNSLQRWFFQPDYECVHVSEDEMAMELVGNGVKLVGEDESVSRDGSRKQTSQVNIASRTYCNSFTRMYHKLAGVSPIWGELRNVIDLSIAAAFIHEMDFYDQAEWDLGVFADESKLPVETFNAPSHVAPVANAVWKGNYFMSPIAGGVNVQPQIALKADNMKTDEDGKINIVKAENQNLELADGQWWWD